MTEQLFVYGTLMDPIVQFAVVGRTAEGRPDTLPDFRKSSLKLGGRVYPIVKPAAGSVVEGLVIMVSPTELGRIDHYEGEAYRRTRATLTSGRQAWVYQA
jgi:gamma-glutamylcyclotransferase (GGCT)/AIG2-like uncharacterized protein YtfP